MYICYNFEHDGHTPADDMCDMRNDKMTIRIVTALEMRMTLYMR